ncbi:MAG: O-antigen ligase family protein [Nitrospira sp. CG24C]|nr:MAG: O-antigen ligase family protein [Nitrospira sp. CG24C]
MWINVARVSAIIAGIGILYSPTVASVALVATYVAFLASGQVVVRFRQVFGRPSVYWAAIFLAVVLIGMTYASVPWSDRGTDLLKWRTILWFVVLLSIFDDERWKTRLLVMFIVGTAVGLVISFVAAAGWVTLLRGPGALLRNSATQSMGFAVAALLCLWMFLEKSLQGHMRWIVPVLGLLYVANIAFITSGRSGYVILGIGCAVLLLWKAAPLRQLAVVLGLSIMAILAFSLSSRMQDYIALGVDQWVQEPESATLTNMASRRVYYQNTVEILQDHWLIGIGTGGFKQAYTEQVTRKYDPSNWRAEPIGDPHNQYLAVLTQHGIGGLAVFLVWIVAIARDMRGLPKYRKLALGLLFGWCVTSLFSSHFRTFAEGHLLTTFLGVLLSAPGMNDHSEVVSSPRDEA